jgi:hypothetical protein
MKVHFEMLQHAADVHEALRKNGWKFDSDQRSFVSASHSEVGDEAMARGRLNEIGLLTSRSVRITFGHSGWNRLNRLPENDGGTAAAPTSSRA